MSAIDSTSLDDATLNRAVAEHCEGYQYAGDFHGRPLLHPAGLRTAVVAVPDYVGSWDACMRLVLRYGMALVPVWEPCPRHIVSRGGLSRICPWPADASVLRRAIAELALTLACTEGA